MSDVETFEKALKARDTVLAMRLMNADPTLIEQKMSSGISPIMLAAYNGGWEIVRYLAEKGAIRTVTDATLANDIELVATMLDKTPEATSTLNEDGFTPLHMACYFGMDAIALDLISRGAHVNAWSENEIHNQPLHAALAGRGSDAVVDALISHGADINSMDHTPLMLAAGNGRAHAVQTLLARGADKTRALPDGRTAADIAAESGHAEIAAAMA